MMNQKYRVLGYLTLCCLSLFPGATIGQAAETLETATPATLAPLPPTDAPTYRRLAGEVEGNFQRHVLGMWYPRAVDREHGGFHQNFKEDWSRGDDDEKSLVYQARLTWMAAQAAMRYRAQATQYRDYSRHGLDFLSRSLWDREQGGLFWAVDKNGQPVRGGEKHVYGISFAIYAASANYKATHDERALDLAKRAFRWLDAHAHDAKNDGYFEALTRAGQPILASPNMADAPASAAPTAADAPQFDAIGTRYGFKSMNSHIHILEAFTALHEVWPDAGLRRRLQEMFEVVRDKIAVESVGCLNLFFTPQWRPLPDHDSFGHDVETAYLLVEASAALGRPNDARTWALARRIVDHALDYGWDTDNGGFYDTGRAFGSPFMTDKIWWVQAEGLNALLLMHERFGRQSPRYWAAFNRQWEFIRRHQVDDRHGGWYATVTREGAPTAGAVKSDAWTEAYHQGRALMNAGTTLRHLSAHL